MEAWQNLLLHLHEDGSRWLRSVNRRDWRKELVERPGPIEEPALKIMRDNQELISWFSSVRSLDVDVCKGTVIRPNRFAPHSLTMLVPFVLDEAAEPKLSIQIGVLFRTHEGGERRFFGYRFESPEEQDQGNDFFHVQPIKAFGRQPACEFSALWHSDKYPSFPVPARNCLELISSAILSWWGWRQVMMLVSGPSFRSEIKRQISSTLDGIRLRD